MPSLRVIVYTDALCTVKECESKVSGGKKPTLLSLDEVISIGKAHTRPPDAWSMGASHQSLSNQQCTRRTRALRRRPSRTRSACSCTPPARRVAARASTAPASAAPPPQGRERAGRRPEGRDDPAEAAPCPDGRPCPRHARGGAGPVRQPRRAADVSSSTEVSPLESLRPSTSRAPPSSL